jgi:ketosteroid isomerase-like protein
MPHVRRPNRAFFHGALVALFAATAMTATANVSVSAGDAAQFRGRDQALLDAIGTGNKAVWENTLSADAIYVDENGAIYSKPRLIKAMINPLPPHVSGHLDITSYRLNVTGDMAVVVHTDDESENWHGHALKAQYIMSEAWRRENGAWKLALVHVYVVPKDPPAISLPAAKLDEYTGHYRAAMELLDVVARNGATLTLSYNGRPAKAFLSESPDMFFIPGEPRFRYLFERDARGHVNGFTERREGENIFWARVE